MFMTVPITYVAAYTQAAGAGLVAPSAAAWSALGLKNGYFQLLHGCDLAISGKQVKQFQPSLNAYVNFKLMSQMSQDELKTIGATIGMGEVLDNYQSQVFNGTSAQATNFPSAPVAVPVGGNGLVNNAPFPPNSATVANGGDQNGAAAQFTGSYNNGMYSRLKRIPDCSGNSGVQNIFGSSTATSATAITNVAKLGNEFKPYDTVLNSNYAVWYDVAIVRMCDILDSMKSLPLMKKFDGIFRAYFNVGQVACGTSASGATDGKMITSGSGITFTNTCPLLESALSSRPTNSAGIAASLFIGNPTATSISITGNTVNFASAGAAHFLDGCLIPKLLSSLKNSKL